MAISTYSELLAAIADWAARPGLLSSVTPDFVTMTEALFNYGDEGIDFEPVRCRQMETTASFTVTTAAVAVPSGFLEAKRLTAATSPVRELTYAEPGWYKEAYPSGQNADSPSFYTVEGTNILSVANFEMVYYTAVPALATNSTNWLLTASPNAYLFGGLLYYSIYQKDDEEAQRYLKMVRGAVRGLQRSDNASRAGRFEKRSSGSAW